MKKTYHAHPDGRKMTLPKWAASPDNIHGLSRECLYDRIQKGMSLIEALTAHPNGGKFYEYQGHRRTLKEWVVSPENTHGLTEKALRARVRRGIPFPDALSKSMRTWAHPDGRRLTAHEWAESPENVHGLSASVIWNRLVKSQWTLEEALSRPLHHRGKRGGKKGSGRKYTHSDGRSLTVQEWVNSPDNIHGLTTSGIRRRFQIYPVDIALSTPPGGFAANGRRIIEHPDGRRMSLAQWCNSCENIHGLTLYGVRYRLLQGMSIDVALNTPRQQGAVPLPSPRESIAPAPKTCIVGKVVKAGRREYRTYWIGLGAWSMTAEPLPLTQGEAERIAAEHAHHGAFVAPLDEHLAA